MNVRSVFLQAFILGFEKALPIPRNSADTAESNRAEPSFQVAAILCLAREHPAILKFTSYVTTNNRPRAPGRIQPPDSRPESAR